MKPSLRPEAPRLTTGLPGPRSINLCQACGAERREGHESLKDVKIWGWQEHDHNDQPEPFSVWLCKKCSDRLIEPHPRLYEMLRPHHPFPGAMPLCLDCKMRDGVMCLSPKAMFNGGPSPGIKLEYPEPSRAHLNLGRKGGRWIMVYNGPVTACDAKEV